MTPTNFDPPAARTALLVLLPMLAAPLASIAQASPPRSEPVPEVAAARLEEEKINQFADAYIVVEAIQTRTAEEIGATHDPQKAAELKASAEHEIVAAIERHGLDLSEFNRISQQMAADRELRLKIAARVRQRRNL